MGKWPMRWVRGWTALAVILLSGCKVSSTSDDHHYGYDDSHYTHGYFLDARDTLLPG